MNTLASATERLTQSREGLRLALSKVASPCADTGGPGTNPFSLDWLVNLKVAPGTRLLLDIFRDWWARQPLRLALTLTADAAGVVLQPIAQRYPLGLVAGAALAGGLIVLTRPWRWISTSALLTGLLPQLIAEALKHMPAQARADNPHPV
ncbi:hypothetical protein GALL_449150 [mine drainage metagenome]|uniref:Uncharacterized protein n=1 Tax=mine drainage metagenome TaxID=410659 RepID=A0A1J5Q0A0_9ZZZZ